MLSGGQGRRAVHDVAGRWEGRAASRAARAPSEASYQVPAGTVMRHVQPRALEVVGVVGVERSKGRRGASLGFNPSQARGQGRAGRRRSANKGWKKRARANGRPFLCSRVDPVGKIE